MVTSPDTDHGTTTPPRRIAAVTVTYNSADVLDDFLASVTAQTGDWSLVVVDNQSTDGTRERLAALNHDRITVILKDRNTGFAGGSNTGVRAALAAGADAVILLNNDTEFGPTLFADLGAAMARHGADAASPVVVFHDRPDTIWYAGGRLVWDRGVRNFHDHSEQSVALAGTADFTTDFCPACCMIFDRSVFDRIGLLDEDYFVYWEDADYCWRMKAAGMRIVVSPAIRLLHKASTLTGGVGSPFFIHNYERNRVLFMRKAAGPVRGVVGAGAVAGNILARFALRRADRDTTWRRLKGVLAGVRAPITSSAKGRAA